MTQEYETFDEMELGDNLLRGIFSHGFEYPSNIQKKWALCLGLELQNDDFNNIFISISYIFII